MPDSRPFEDYNAISAKHNISFFCKNRKVLLPALNGAGFLLGEAARCVLSCLRFHNPGDLMNLSKYEYMNKKNEQESAAPSESTSETTQGTVFGKQFSEKEQKSLFLYLVIGIVLVELAVTVGAIIISITNAQPSASGVPRFQFPWLGYLVAVVMVPVLAMLLVNLVSLGFSRESRGGVAPDMQGVPPRMQTFFALVRGAPTIILFAGFVLMGAAIYYLEGVMAILMKIGEQFHLVAIWIVGGFAAAWTVSYAVRAWMAYKTRQMEAEYAFRHEVLERTGMVILDTKYAPTTDLRMLPPAPGGQPPATVPALDVTSTALPVGKDDGDASEKTASTTPESFASDMSEYTEKAPPSDDAPEQATPTASAMPPTELLEQHDSKPGHLPS